MVGDGVKERKKKRDMHCIDDTHVVLVGCIVYLFIKCTCIQGAGPKPHQWS